MPSLDPSRSRSSKPANTATITATKSPGVPPPSSSARPDTGTSSAPSATSSLGKVPQKSEALPVRKSSLAAGVRALVGLSSTQRDVKPVKSSTTATAATVSKSSRPTTTSTSKPSAMTGRSSVKTTTTKPTNTTTPARNVVQDTKNLRPFHLNTPRSLEIPSSRSSTNTDLTLSESSPIELYRLKIPAFPSLSNRNPPTDEDESNPKEPYRMKIPSFQSLNNTPLQSTTSSTPNPGGKTTLAQNIERMKEAHKERERARAQRRRDEDEQIMYDDEERFNIAEKALTPRERRERGERGESVATIWPSIGSFQRHDDDIAEEEEGEKRNGEVDVIDVRFPERVYDGRGRSFEGRRSGNYGGGGEEARIKKLPDPSVFMTIDLQERGSVGVRGGYGYGNGNGNGNGGGRGKKRKCFGWMVSRRVKFGLIIGVILMVLLVVSLAVAGAMGVL